MFIENNSNNDNNNNNNVSIYIYMYKYHHVFVLFKGRSYPIMTLERHNGCSNNWRSRHGVNPEAHLQFDSDFFWCLNPGLMLGKIDTGTTI